MRLKYNPDTMLSWNLRLKTKIPKIRLSSPNVDPVRVVIITGIVVLIVISLWVGYAINTAVEAYVISQKRLDVRIEEQLVPLKARIEFLEDKVKGLDAHAIIKYYKYHIPKKRAILKNGKIVGYRRR